MPDGRVIENTMQGEPVLLSDSGMKPEPDSQKFLHYWAWDCRTVLQLEPYGAAMLLKLADDRSYLIAGDVYGDKLLGGLARDGSAYALTSQRQEQGSEVSDLLHPMVNLVELHVGLPPDFKPMKVLSAVEFANANPYSGVSYSFLAPAVWPGGGKLAVPYRTTVVDVTYTDIGVSAMFAGFVHLLLVDVENETVSKQCETIGQVACGRTLVAAAVSPDLKSVFLAAAISTAEGFLPEAIVWRPTPARPSGVLTSRSVQGSTRVLDAAGDSHTRLPGRLQDFMVAERTRFVSGSWRQGVQRPPVQGSLGSAHVPQTLPQASGPQPRSACSLPTLTNAAGSDWLLNSVAIHSAVRAGPLDIRTSSIAPAKELLLRPM
jgi:hypothetical protein